MIRRLRERTEPVRLFGESDYDAFQRLKKLEILEPEVKVGCVAHCNVRYAYCWLVVYSLHVLLINSLTVLRMIR